MIDTVILVIGLIGLAIVLPILIAYPYCIKALLGKRVGWEASPCNPLIIDQINDISECTYIVLRHGEVSRDGERGKLLVLKQSFAQYTPRAQATLSSAICHALLIRRDCSKLRAFVDHSKNYQQWMSLENGDMLVYKVSSLLKFMKHFERIS